MLAAPQKYALRESRPLLYLRLGFSSRYMLLTLCVLHTEKGYLFRIGAANPIADFGYPFMIGAATLFCDIGDFFQIGSANLVGYIRYPFWIGPAALFGEIEYTFNIDAADPIDNFCTPSQ